MKLVRKIATLLLAICLVVPCFSMVSHAANRIMFEDPSTAVGQTLQLKGVVQTDSAMEDRKVVMTYDTSVLKFVSGDDVTETASGQLTYDAKGEVGGQRVEFVMSFEVLKEGTTQVQVESYTVYNTSDQKLTCEKGYSTITIAAGEAPAPAEEPIAAAGAIVEVNGETYTFSDSFEAADIPEGFEESTLEYAGTNYKVVVQAETGLYLGYLVNGSGEGKFFLYVEENATFAPFEQIKISDSTVITLLSNVEDIVFPESYKKTGVEVKGVVFPAWQSTENTDVRVFYAMNNRGEKSLYQYDTVEDTYQRFEMPEVEEEKEADTIVAKFSELLGENLNTVVLAIGIGFILLLILVIVLSVKLYNRNAELDELYDEYGIDLLDDEETEKKATRIIKLDEEDEFDDVEEELEDDIVIAELDEVEEDSEEDDSEVEVTFFEQEKSETKEDPEDVMKLVAAEVEADENYWDDDEDIEFEMDFIDLDD